MPIESCTFNSPETQIYANRRVQWRQCRSDGAPAPRAIPHNFCFGSFGGIWGVRPPEETSGLLAALRPSKAHTKTGGVRIAHQQHRGLLALGRVSAYGGRPPPFDPEYKGQGQRPPSRLPTARAALTPAPILLDLVLQWPEPVGGRYVRDAPSRPDLDDVRAFRQRCARDLVLGHLLLHPVSPRNKWAFRPPVAPTCARVACALEPIPLRRIETKTLSQIPR